MTTSALETREAAPVSRRVGYRPAMIERWPNYGKLMKATEKSGFFRALPWLAQSGIVRAVFPGGHVLTKEVLSPPGPGAAVAQW
jgi:hypothetical protein